MKSVKINYPMALLLIIAIMAPLTAIGGPRNGTVARPIDDQPWGGEIDTGNFRAENISSESYNPYPSQFDIIGIRNIGTPLVLFDYLSFVIFDKTIDIRNSSSINRTNTFSVPESKTIAPLTIKTRRFSIRKGR